MIKFKHEIDRKMFGELNVFLLMVFTDFAVYAKEKHDWDIVVTDTISTLQEDINIGRKSDSHRLGISLDFRTRDVDTWVLQDCVDYIENKPEYEKYKYLSFSGKKRFIYLHDSGHGHHGHFQIHKKYATQ